MASKPASKKTNTKPKSNVAKPTLASKLKLPKKSFLIVIILIFVAALGYLFLRLSRASIEGASWTADQFQLHGGSVTTKADGRKAWVSSDPNAFASVVDGEWMAARGDQAWCLDVRLETDASAKIEIDVFSSVPDASGNTLLTRNLWTVRAKGQEQLLCPQNAWTAWNSNVPKQLDAGALTRTVNIIVNGGSGGETEGGTIAVFKIARALVPGTYMQLPAPPPATTTTPSQNQQTTVAPQDQPNVCPTYTLGLNSSGDCVKYAQGLLNSALRLTGTKDQLAVDGNYGTRTVNAVKMFQGSIGKTGNANDGIIGAGTWPKLIERANANLTVAPPTEAVQPCVANASDTSCTQNPPYAKKHASEADRTKLVFYKPHNKGIEPDPKYYNTGDKGYFAVPWDDRVKANIRVCAWYSADNSVRNDMDRTWKVKMQTKGLVSPAGLTDHVLTFTIKKGETKDCIDWKPTVSFSPFGFWKGTDDMKVQIVRVEPGSLSSIAPGWNGYLEKINMVANY